MAQYIEKIKNMTLPLVPLDECVVFPAMPITVELNAPAAIAACESAVKNGGNAFFVLRRTSDAEAVASAFSVDTDGKAPISDKDVYGIGCVAEIKQFAKLRDTDARVVLEGVSRAELGSVSTDPYGIPSAAVMSKEVVLPDIGIDGEAAAALLRESFTEFTANMPKISSELEISVRSIRSPGLLADFIANTVLTDAKDKQSVLGEFDPVERAKALALILRKNGEMFGIELDIRRKVQARIDKSQREYYLREQLKVIQGELEDAPFHDGDPQYGGLYDEDDAEVAEYMDKIHAAHTPPEVEEKLIKETKKLAKTPYNSAEAGVIRSYLDICLELPWGKRSRDRVDIAEAKRILDRDHDGLEKVKERILEYLAVKQLNPDLRHQILCFVGPPGTGKTSVARSIATSMKRKYVRVSLGGIRDEADIRGHRKTYIGSMPGRIVTAINQAGVCNPLILLDEIDKLTHDAHGDPASAMLEVLDSEQNKAFRDHFIELPIDLSECMFIATANSVDTIPRPLLDRMELIELKSYTRNEKVSIAKHHLIPKQRKRHGLSYKSLRITDGALVELIDFYTAEAGVRNLERELASICRKVAKELVEDSEKTSVTVDKKDIGRLLGPRKIIPENIEESSDVGEVNGLAYTDVGGDLLHIEAVAMPGTGKLELTGSLGDVMKESAHAALTYIRAHADELEIDPDFYKTRDIHIHVPEGAVPKDGPSAGVTIATALASELSGRRVKRDVAMTGEITLHGRVLAIGGLREKTMAAYKTGVKTVLIPKDNIRDLEEIDPLVRAGLRFVPCAQIGDVFAEALTPPVGAKKPDTANTQTRA